MLPFFGEAVRFSQSPRFCKNMNGWGAHILIKSERGSRQMLQMQNLLVLLQIRNNIVSLY